eukprot:GFUD01038770.1.p1 GENE.GFUD01038770.1~~GFUD01038770.1.p1  ORF type:complete len:318 (+),score=24.69 GFUD01038770.1:501-1454(+)
MNNSEALKICFLLLILECMVGFCDYRSGNKKRHGQTEEEETKKLGFRLWSSGPNFDTDLPQDVSGVVGQTAYLTCRVFDRTNKTISWIRHADLHILTVGRYTYTADNRYQSIYNPTTDEWILQIKYLQKRDSGMYECQVSTQPVRSFFVRLNILDETPSKLYGEESIFTVQNEEEVAHAEITGGTEVHVEQGSTLNLTCIVKNSKEKPHYLLWYHRNETIDYTSPRGGISVVNSENNSPEITSTLLIYQVGDSDSGKYSCRPSNTDVATTTVYVIRDEHQQNLKSINNNGHKNMMSSSFLSLLVLKILAGRVVTLER